VPPTVSGHGSVWQASSAFGDKQLNQGL
jgi:hypothetical protein